MKQVTVTRDIAAPSETVWAILTDPAQLVALETGITSLEGDIGEGSTFRLMAEASGARAFKIRVSGFEPPRRMEWSSGAKPMFHGVRVFALTPVPGGTRLEMTETFTGLMLPMIWRSMQDLTPTFERFAAAVAGQAERKAA